MSDRLSFPVSPVPPSAPINDANGALHREVHPELEPNRVRHRKAGEVPYPLVYTSEILNLYELSPLPTSFRD